MEAETAVQIGIRETAKVFGPRVLAEIVRGDGLRLAEAKLEGLSRILGCRVQRMRAGMQQHQRVHLETQLHDRAGLREASVEDHFAVVRDRDLAEPVDV